jgi:hypothetical protein
MSDPSRQKPLPARPPSGDARPVSGDARPSPIEPPTPTTPVPEEPETMVSGRGGMWRVTVLGRSGRAEARSAPLMLLGFSSDPPGAARLEAMVAGRSVLDIPQEALESALARAREPVPGDRKRPFFEDADGARGS